MLNENELLESLARELGVIMINCRSAELREDKLRIKIEELQTFITDKDNERTLLLERLKKVEDAHKELREKFNGKNPN